MFEGRYTHFSDDMRHLRRDAGLNGAGATQGARVRVPKVGLMASEVGGETLGPWENPKKKCGKTIVFLPICFMYGIFTNIHPKNDPNNVGSYSIHGACGLGKSLIEKVGMSTI